MEAQGLSCQCIASDIEPFHSPSLRCSLVHFFDVVGNGYFLVPHGQPKKNCLNIGSRFCIEFHRVGIVEVKMWEVSRILFFFWLLTSNCWYKLDLFFHLYVLSLTSPFNQGNYSVYYGEVLLVHIIYTLGKLSTILTLLNGLPLSLLPEYIVPSLGFNFVFFILFLFFPPSYQVGQKLNCSLIFLFGSISDSCPERKEQRKFSILVFITRKLPGKKRKKG